MKTKVIALLFAVLTLSACDDSPRDVSSIYKLPPELNTCKVYQISGSRELVIVHCPNATTTTTSTYNKLQYSDTVISD